MYHRPAEAPRVAGVLKQQCCNTKSEPVSSGGRASVGICAGAGTVLTEDDVVVFVIIFLQLPELLGILAGVLVQAGVNREVPSSFICLKAFRSL